MPTCSSRPLLGLLVAQFFGAFNDNAWKYVVLTLALRPIVAETEVTGADFNQASQFQATLTLLAFTLPMMIFSLPGGLLADRRSKRSVIIAMKAVEVVLMGAALLALVIDPSGLSVVPLVILGLMGVQSALFSPAKYGILPEIVPHERLSFSNGLLHGLMMVAIIAGTGLGPVLLLADAPDANGVRPGLTFVAPLLLVVLALVGLGAAIAIPRVPSPRSTGGIRATVRGGWTALRSDRALTLAVVGSAVGMLIISLIGQNVYVYVRDVTRAMKNDELISGLPPALFAIGIGAGAVVAGKLSQSRVETGLIPLGSLVFALVALVLGFVQPLLVGTMVLMLLMGLGAGMLVVPLNAIMQWRSPADRRGAVISVANILQLAGVIIGSVGANLLAETGLSAGEVLLVSALFVVAATAWAVWLLPSALLRLGLVLLTQLVYRLDIIGSANVPKEGGAVLTPNHMSGVDGLLVMASLDRPVRFLVHAKMYHKWWLLPFVRLLGALEISSTGGPRRIIRALRDAGRYVDQGDLVCIFPEGQSSHTGAMLPFNRGLEHIVKGRTTPIIPVHLDRIWGSIFSFKRRRFVWKVPERLPYPVTISFGEPLPGGTPVSEVRRAVMELGTAAWEHRKQDRRPLHRTFLRAARRRPLRCALGDGTRPRVSRVRALAGAIALARALRARWENERRVGILLPPSVAGALVNIAASVSGRTSVNLNYTAGQAGMESAARQAELRSVVTSREFLEKARVSLPENVEPVWVEDLTRGIGPGAKLIAMMLALFAPARVVEHMCGSRGRVALDDDVTVIFSSGSTGEPKGVRLSHYNVDSNVEAVAQVFNTGKDDRLLGILPLFHSFGYMTTWFALNHGIGVVCHPHPLDADAIGEIVERNRITMLVATPTFLGFYEKRCAPAKFGSLRLVLTGAEKLPQRLSDAFEDHFGIRPLEGYGTTECAPVIATGTLDVRFEGLYQPGSKRGTVGHPLPGVSVRVVDPETFELLGPGEPGLVIVKGPNVMRGYLGRDDLTRGVMHDDWYITGDIAVMDEDGYLRITDRLSRFSKIGGEMVPHGRVEEALHRAAGVSEPTFAVTGLPDEKKGERLAVLHTMEEDSLSEIFEELGKQGLPNLFIPRADQFVRIEALPFLGTGKLDLRAIKSIAFEKLKRES